MSEYKVIHPLKYKGVTYKQGEIIDLPDEVASKVSISIIKIDEVIENKSKSKKGNK